MARQVRIEFPGAFYHVMARGNRLNPIFVSPDGADEELFLTTLGEACERSGFRVWAWVLMRNHYHLVLEAPKANLVAGMSWLQNTYTRRFNVRHKEWGRLFGDRYKSILIDDDRSGGGSSYLASLLDYVHLNPARAKLIAPGNENRSSLLDYPWSSVSRGYALAPGKRPVWLSAAAGLELFGLRDTVKDRRLFVERLDGRMAAEKAEQCGLAEIEDQTLNSSLRRGWYWGSEAFKESMLDLLDQRSDSDEGLPTSRPYQIDDQAEDFAVVAAERLIAEGVAHFQLAGVGSEQFAALPKGDVRRDAIAWMLWKKSTLPQRWIADRLALRSAANVSDRVRKFDRKSPKAQ
ncbi:MAG: transposase, partial [Acidobacteria bacterium]|nr:transposase [Acidobacteriota bacterium]